MDIYFKVNPLVCFFINIYGFWFNIQIFSFFAAHTRTHTQTRTYRDTCTMVNCSMFYVYFCIVGKIEFGFSILWPQFDYDSKNVAAGIFRAQHFPQTDFPTDLTTRLPTFSNCSRASLPSNWTPASTSTSLNVQFAASAAVAVAASSRSNSRCVWAGESESRRRRSLLLLRACCFCWRLYAAYREILIYKYECRIIY